MPNTRFDSRDQPMRRERARSLAPGARRSPVEVGTARPGGVTLDGSNDYNAVIAVNRFDAMATLTIRNLDEDTKTRLRVQAARHGRSMEEEARTLLAAAVRTPASRSADLATAIRRRFEPLGGVELDLPVREAGREPPKFRP